MPKGNLAEEERTHSIIGAFYSAYNQLGHGFLEHLCRQALHHELRKRGHTVQREVQVDVFYRGEKIGLQRLDMIVDGCIVVEVKSSPVLHNNPTRQVLNYLKATDLELGFVFHFGKEPNFERVYLSNARKTQYG